MIVITLNDFCNVAYVECIDIERYFAAVQNISLLFSKGSAIFPEQILAASIFLNGARIYFDHWSYFPNSLEELPYPTYVPYLFAH